MDHPLRIYSDQTLAPDGHCTLLDPFWGMPDSDPRDPLHGRFDAYYECAGDLFEMASLEDADIAVLPFDYGHVLTGKRSWGEVNQFLERVVSAGKRLLVFCWHDSSEPLPLPEADTIIFRTAIDRSRRRPNEYCLPTFHEDFVEKHCDGEFPVREWTERPTVSFCGRASRPRGLPTKMRESLRQLKRRLVTGKTDFPYGDLRLKALQLLSENDGVECRFVTHSAFWGGLGDNARECSVEDRSRARIQYVNNMRESDYVLCIRGAGNFSMRLYETLCMGRIPIILDTDSVFPFDDTLTWDGFLLRIPSSKLATLGECLLSFHGQNAGDDFQQLQYACRHIWIQYLAPHGFFKCVSKALSTDALAWQSIRS